jgi:uncharacterized protein (TIGR02594 family)
MIETSAFQIAQRFVGTKEVPGTMSNPLILAMLKLDSSWPADDAVAWCSAFTSFIAWICRLPRSKSLGARSWLNVGIPISLQDAKADSDVVILKRGPGVQPGPEVIEAPGHVGFFAGVEGDRVLLLAGNQGDAVNVSSFPISNILGIRRL